MKKIITFVLVLLFVTMMGFCIEVESYSIDSDLVFAGAEYLGSGFEFFYDMKQNCNYLFDKACDVKMLKKHDNVFNKALEIYDTESEEVYIAFMYIKSKNNLSYTNKWVVRLCIDEEYTYSYTDWVVDNDKFTQIANACISME